MRHDPLLPRRAGLSVLLLVATVIGALLGTLPGAEPGPTAAAAPAPPLPPLADPPAPPETSGVAQVADPAVAAGGIRLSDEWTETSFDADLVDPVVVLGPAGRNDPDPVTARLGRIARGGFTARLVEWPGTERPGHEQELLPWLAVDRGAHELASGGHVEAGSVVVPAGESAASAPLVGSHESAPAVFVAPLTATAPPLTPVVTGTSTTAFEVTLVTEDGEPADQPVRIEYIAWPASAAATTPGLTWATGTVGLRGDGRAAPVPEHLAPRTERCSLASLHAAGAAARSLRWVVASDGAVGVWAQPGPGAGQPTEPGRAELLALPCGAGRLAAGPGMPTPAPPRPPSTGAVVLLIVPPAAPALTGDASATMTEIAEGRRSSAPAVAHGLDLRTGAYAGPGTESVVGALAAAGIVDAAAIGRRLVTRWAGTMQTDPLVISIFLARDTSELDTLTAEVETVVGASPHLAGRTHVLTLDASGGGGTRLSWTGPVRADTATEDGARRAAAVEVPAAAVANHMLRLVGLPPVPDSQVNVSQSAVGSR